MFIINPRVVIEPTSKIRQKLFGHKHRVYLLYAQEHSNHDTRSCSNYKDHKKVFKSAREAIKHAEYIKSLVEGLTVTELYSKEIKDKLDLSKALSEAYSICINGVSTIYFTYDNHCLMTENCRIDSDEIFGAKPLNIEDNNWTVNYDGQELKISCYKIMILN
jgi:hypothetical protein